MFLLCFNPEKAYDSIDQKIKSESKKSNSLIGVGKYKQKEKKHSTLKTDTLSVDVGVQLEAPSAGFKY